MLVNQTQTRGTHNITNESYCGPGGRRLMTPKQQGPSQSHEALQQRLADTRQEPREFKVARN